MALNAKRLPPVGTRVSCSWIGKGFIVGYNDHRRVAMVRFTEVYDKEEGNAVLHDGYGAILYSSIGDKIYVESNGVNDMFVVPVEELEVIVDELSWIPAAGVERAGASLVRYDDGNDMDCCVAFCYAGKWELCHWGADVRIKTPDWYIPLESIPLPRKLEA